MEIAAGSPEVDRFATQLAEAFRGAGIKVNEINIVGQNDSGIMALAGQNRFVFLQTIADALTEAKVITAPLPMIRAINPDALKLTILPKPQ